MPFDSEGKFTRVHDWEQDRIDDISIDSYRMDEEFNNYADGLGETLLRDGRVPMTGNLNVGGFGVKNIVEGRQENDAVNLKQLTLIETTIKALISKTSSSVGDVKMSALTTNHNEWILCNGQELDRSLYSELFGLIGTRFGSGNGTTSFNVPDYRGKFIRGLGGDSAADMGTTQAEGLPNITATADVTQGASRSYNATGAFYQTNNGNGGNWDTAASCKLNLDASRSSKIYGASNHVTPINQALNFFIKAKTEA